MAASVFTVIAAALSVDFSAATLLTADMVTLAVALVAAGGAQILGAGLAIDERRLVGRTSLHTLFKSTDGSDGVGLKTERR